MSVIDYLVIKDSDNNIEFELPSIESFNKFFSDIELDLDWILSLGNFKYDEH